MEIIFAKRILDSMDSGFIIVDKDLNVKFWNRWLQIQTGKLSKEVEGKKLDELFPIENSTSIKRKIKTVLAMKSTVFYNAHSAKPLIEISRPNITNSIFDIMKQKVTISLYNAHENLVCINIVDETILHEANYKLEQNVKSLEKINSIDSLTKIFNRSKFYERINHEIKMADRYNIELGLVFFDIDHFKKINDQYGHQVGDDVLVEITSRVSAYIREVDTFARWGGEEFIILVPGSSEQSTFKLAEKCRLLIQSTEFTDKKINVTSSFGVSNYKSGETVENLFLRVDKSLYRAKANGRNKVNKSF